MAILIIIGIALYLLASGKFTIPGATTAAQTPCSAVNTLAKTVQGLGSTLASATALPKPMAAMGGGSAGGQSAASQAGAVTPSGTTPQTPKVSGNCKLIDCTVSCCVNKEVDLLNPCGVQREPCAAPGLSCCVTPYTPPACGSKGSCVQPGYCGPCLNYCGYAGCLPCCC